jgi:signal transduction histidine kinase
LKLSVRLLLAAAAIVAVSLLISGALSWLLVRQLEINNARDQLALQVISEHALVQRQECANIGTTCLPRTLAGGAEYEARLRTDAEALPGDRLLLISRGGSVVFDSQNPDNTSQIRLGRTRVVQQQPVTEGDVVLDGQNYIASGAGLTPAHNPLGAAVVVVARPTAAVSAQASGDLAPLLLLAGVISLLVSVGLALLATRALTRPLSELAAAAEDVASGNYSRRVAIAGGDEIGVLGSAFNRMAEAVERARALQRDFLANVSHELKTPLTSLIGFSQALVDGSLRADDERNRAAAIIHEESERVLRMAQELLDLARVESGQISLNPQPVDLGAQLEQELELVRKRAEARDLHLELSTAAALPPVNADPERLHQVLDNLLDNAVKYAPRGSTIAVVAAVAPEGVTTTVSNPAGEHRPDPQRMFDRFYRADPSRSSSAGGVGLGLAISRELVQAHGGRLWAELVGDDLKVHLLLPRPSGGFAATSPAGGEEVIRSAAPPATQGSPAGASPRP